ncbi:MAG: GAF domain-containing protein, partial [Myxococcaceae bacterium]|nr:GAF domain-containing protein [Myxococcaceae bacterium]
MSADASGPSDPRSAEARRLAVLASYEVMDTPPDPALDTITRLASQLLGLPVALVSLLDDQRQWFKSRHGLDLSQTPREIALCDHVVRSGEALVIADATRDDRFRDNPLVHDEPHVRFYAGVPLRVPEGEVLGTLCALDYAPRTLDAGKLQVLSDLAELAVRQLMLHRRERALQRARGELERQERFFESSQDLNCIASTDGRFLVLNPRWTEVLGFSREELMAEPYLHFVHPDDRATTMKAIIELRATQALQSFRNRYRCNDGSYRWLEWSAHPTGREDGSVFATARDVSQAVAAEHALQLRNGILSLITDAQARFITDGADAAWWDFVLERLLRLTDSQYGFIGMTESEAGAPFLRTKAITNIAWDDETRAFYEAHAPAGMVFRNLKTLFGHAMLTQQRYLSNDVAHDPHAGGRPAGHPPLNAFAGLPIKDGTQMVGLVGLANRPEGYTEDLIQSLEPVLAFLGKVLNVLRLKAQQRSFLIRLEASKELQERVLEASETGFLALGADGSVALANRRARELVGVLRNGAWSDAPGDLEAAVGAILAEPEACRWALSLLRGSEPSVLGPRKVRLRDALDATATVEVTVTRFRQEPDRPAGLLLALADLRQRSALEETLRRNASLEERVTQLRQQQRDNEILSECVEYLQRCASLDEGLELVSRSLERLFPTGNFALYCARDGSSAMTLRREARRFGDAAAATELPLTQCWALRTRRAYGAWPGSHHLACQHSTAADRGPTYCVPLFTLERNVAVFSVSLPEEDGR